jgi:protein-disulfide isomerase
MKQWDSSRAKQGIIILASILALAIGVVWYSYLNANIAGAPKNGQLSVVLGSNKKAPKMIVYTDILCERCQEYHDKTLKKVKENFVDKGKLQLDIRPIAIVSERSSNLTELALCADDQGAFLPAMEYMYKDLYSEESTNAEKQAATFFKRHSFKEIAKHLSINEKELADCKTERRYDEKIAKADQKAQESEVYSAPTTFIEGNEPIRGYAQYRYISSLLEVL